MNPHPDTPVLIIGAGPVGLVLAQELAHHGVASIIVERDLAALHAHGQFWHIFFSTPATIISQDEIDTWTVQRYFPPDFDPSALASEDVVADAHARELYERDLVLLRPDQHVAWRGNAGPGDPGVVIDTARGMR